MMNQNTYILGDPKQLTYFPFFFFFQKQKFIPSRKKEFKYQNYSISTIFKLEKGSVLSVCLSTS